MLRPPPVPAERQRLERRIEDAGAPAPAPPTPPPDAGPEAFYPPAGTAFLRTGASCPAIATPPFEPVFQIPPPPEPQKPHAGAAAAAAGGPGREIQSRRKWRTGWKSRCGVRRRQTLSLEGVGLAARRVGLCRATAAPSGPRGNAARGNGAGGGDPRADATRGNDPRSDAAPAARAGRTSAAGKPHRGRRRPAPAANPAARRWTGVLPTAGTAFLRTGGSCPAGAAGLRASVPDSSAAGTETHAGAAAAAAGGPGRGIQSRRNGAAAGSRAAASRRRARPYPWRGRACRSRPTARRQANPRSRSRRTHGPEATASPWPSSRSPPASLSCRSTTCASARRLRISAIAGAQAEREPESREVLLGPARAWRSRAGLIRFSQAIRRPSNEGRPRQRRLAVPYPREAAKQQRRMTCYNKVGRSWCV